MQNIKYLIYINGFLQGFNDNQNDKDIDKAINHIKRFIQRQNNPIEIEKQAVEQTLLN